MGHKLRTKITTTSKIGREKQEKWDKATLLSKRVCKKKDLISSVERSHPSKLLAFFSCQIHHIKQCSTVSKSLCCDAAQTYPTKTLKQLNNLVRHNPVNSKQTKRQWPQLTSYGVMKKRVINYEARTRHQRCRTRVRCGDASRTLLPTRPTASCHVDSTCF